MGKVLVLYIMLFPKKEINQQTATKTHSTNWQWSMQYIVVHPLLAKAYIHFALFVSKQIVHTLRTDVLFSFLSPFFLHCIILSRKIDRYSMT